MARTQEPENILGPRSEARRTAPAEAIGPNALDGIADDHRGISLAPVLGLEQAESMTVTDLLVTTVGASTHDRYIRSDVINMTGGDTTPPGNLVGKSLSTGYGPAPIVYAGDYGNPLCLPGSWAPNTFTDEIVVCDRGTNGRVEKSGVVQAAGGDGMVLANDPPNAGTLNGDAHIIPSSHISHADGVVLKQWLATGSGHMATISDFSVSEDAAFGDHLAAFSSRGQNRALPDIVTPSITAPGLDIFAAYQDQSGATQDFNIVSGTSMASPHVAGAAALIMALHPDWSPAEVQSAMMLTAQPDLVLEDGVTPADPFDIGNGRIDVPATAQAGLVMHETIENYEGANPAVGTIEVKELNLASMGEDECMGGSCSWTRTVRATTDGSWTASGAVGPDLVTVTVAPAAFSLSAGQTQELTITAVSSSAPDTGIWEFGHAIIEGTGGPMHMPVAIKSVSDPTAVTTADFSAGSGTTLPLALFGLTAVGLAGLALWRRRSA